MGVGENFRRGGDVSQSRERATHHVRGGFAYQIAVEMLGTRVSVRAGGCQNLLDEKESLLWWATRGCGDGA
jgi:hypothetical protein